MNDMNYVNETAIMELGEIRILLIQALRRFRYSPKRGKELIQYVLNKVDVLQTENDSMKETIFEVSATCVCCEFENIVRYQVKKDSTELNRFFTTGEMKFRGTLIESGWKQQTDGKWICPRCLLPGVKEARARGPYLFGKNYSKQKAKSRPCLAAV